MAVDLCSRDYGVGVCRLCQREFQRGSGAATVCRAEACQRARREEAQQRHQRKRTARQRLLAHEEAFRDTAAQLAYDLPRRLGTEALLARWKALAEAQQAAPSDPDAQIALRQALLDLAAVAVLIAANLPPPSVALRLEPSVKQQVAASMAAVMAVGA